MKRLLLLLGIIGLWAGCEQVDFPYRRDTRGDRTAIDPGRQRDSAKANPGSSLPDTVMWVCAVKVPEGYDWARDTASGRFDGELLLYRNSDPVLRVPTGEASRIGPEPGSHHIARGHLYTEYHSAGRTYICKDAAPLFTFEDGGFLKGLLPLPDGSLMSLSCIPGGGLALRKDSLMLTRIGRGRAIGGFGEGWPVFYMEDGRCCFNYFDSGNLFTVKDGAVSTVAPPESGAEAEDCRRWKGEDVILWRNASGHHLQKGTVCMDLVQGDPRMHLFEAGGALYAWGGNKSGMRNHVVVYDTDSFKRLFLYGKDSWLYGNGAGLFAVNAKGPLSVYFANRTPVESKPLLRDNDYFVFSDECVASYGKDPFLGVSSPGKPPRLIRGDRAVGELPFEGYITAVDVEIIPPSL